ncbi:MAG TPA: DUF4252 domain-containing protein [Candidatus Krumholzibacteria bacterium]|nr:DUF4252 domain-containing protein [Candidatus Krumholzibacteria bacterium]
MRRSFSTLRGLAMIALLAALSSPGCFWSPELAGVRADLQHQLPGSSFDKNIELSLGPVMMTFARVATSMIPGAREARPYLRGVSRVQVGVYESHIDHMEDVQMPKRLQSLLDAGWETAVRVRDEREAVWLLYRPDGEEVKEIFVVVLNDDELVMVKARGNLERLVAAAMDEAHGHRGFLDDLGS